jgi:hypothetical protein
LALVLLIRNDGLLAVGDVLPGWLRDAGLAGRGLGLLLVAGRGLLGVAGMSGRWLRTLAGRWLPVAGVLGNG